MARDESRQLADALREATDRLRGFNREVDDTTRSQAERNREERAASQQRVNAGLGAAASAIGAVGSTGDYADGLASITRSTIGALRSAEVFGVKVGEIGAEVTGYNRAERILGRAAERTLDVTADFAKYGMDVSDELRQETFDIFREQESRIEDERRKVTSLAYRPDQIGVEMAKHMQNLTQSVAEIATRLRGLTGGAGN